MNILEEANGLVHGDRQANYGHPYFDFSRTAQMWTAILGHSITAEQVAMCMIAVKLSRLCNAYKRDSVVDIAGYAATLEMVVNKRQEFGPGGDNLGDSHERVREGNP